MIRVLVDAGPLVATLSKRDQFHDLCLDTIGRLPKSLVSCWPVIAEAAWLLRRHGDAVENLLSQIGEGLIEILHISNSEAHEIAGLLKKYRSLRPQFADAALVHLANRESIDTIFTLDRRNFSVYRSARNRPFRIIPELR